MRAWDIKDWQNKKLRSRSWKTTTYMYTNTGWWNLVVDGIVRSERSNTSSAVFELFNYSDIEEYVEPKKEQDVEKRDRKSVV
jgi:hypothetical protein